MARSALRALDRSVDGLNKNFCKFVKNTYEPGSDVYEALSGIPTEQGTADPEPIDIHELVQGGDDICGVAARSTGGTQSRGVPGNRGSV